MAKKTKAVKSTAKKDKAPKKHVSKTSNAPKKNVKEIKSKEVSPKGMLMQIVGFGMMTIGFLLIVLPFAVDFFQKDEDTSYTQEHTFTESKIDEDASLDGDAISTTRVDAATASAKAKSDANQKRMVIKGEWIATDYEEGDIGVGNYEVQQGDTLWEISQAVYGNGAQWTNILERNVDQIGFLPNGSQALIIPGQILVIAK